MQQLPARLFMAYGRIFQQLLARSIIIVVIIIIINIYLGSIYKYNGSSPYELKTFKQKDKES